MFFKSLYFYFFLSLIVTVVGGILVWQLLNGINPLSDVPANPTANQSISRTAGIDTDNNSIDFIISTTPTPGS